MFFRHDPLHVFRLGIARNFLASSIILFCTDGYYDSHGDREHSLLARLGRAWASFDSLCDAHGQRPQSIRSFSKEKLHYSTCTSYPFISCKGSDRVLLLKYVQWFSGLQIAGSNNAESVRLVKLGCDGSKFGGIHRHGLWLTQSCRDHPYRITKSFCHTYCKLAAHCYQRQLRLYGLAPKAQALGHIYVDLEECWRNSFSINPAVRDCSSSEDFAGRVGRQSRRVSYCTVVHNTLPAYLIKTRFVVSRFKKAKRTAL